MVTDVELFESTNTKGLWTVIKKLLTVNHILILFKCWNDKIFKTTIDVPKSHKQHIVFAHKLQSPLRLMDFLSNILNLFMIQRILCSFYEFVLCCCDETWTHVVCFCCLHSDPYFYSSVYVTSTFCPSTSVTSVFHSAMFGLNVVVELILLQFNFQMLVHRWVAAIEVSCCVPHFPLQYLTRLVPSNSSILPSNIV